jgi:hypothetical protein
VGTESWSITRDPPGDRIVLEVKGQATAGPAREFAEKFAALSGTTSFVLVVDLRELTSYSAEVRRIWQELLLKHRRQVHTIYVIGAKSSLVRMGASAVALFANISIAFFDKPSDVPKAPSGPDSKK